VSGFVKKESPDDLRGFNPRYVPDLRGHISQCEWNYHSLMKLMPALDSEDLRSFVVERADRVMRIDMRVSERCKYTTILSVSQNLDGEEGSDGTAWLEGPSMTVRLYHDAAMAEVISFQQQRGIPPRNAYPNPRMHHRDEKAQLNRFLGDWVKHCLHHGQVAAEAS
jgi:uncharacterized protein YqiB (DUF1249 family)